MDAQQIYDFAGVLGCPSPTTRFLVTSFNRMGLWIEREFGTARVEFVQVGAPWRSDLPQREFAAYTLTVGIMTHHRSRLTRIYALMACR